MLGVGGTVSKAERCDPRAIQVGPINPFRVTSDAFTEQLPKPGRVWSTLISKWLVHLVFTL